MAKKKAKKRTKRKATKKKATKKKATKKKATKRKTVKAAKPRIVAKSIKVKDVNWVLCLVLSILFGSIGVDRFLMGQIGWGILKLITFGGLGVWWLVDLILIATKYQFKGIRWVD